MFVIKLPIFRHCSTALADFSQKYVFFVSFDRGQSNMQLEYLYFWCSELA